MAGLPNYLNQGGNATQLAPQSTGNLPAGFWGWDPGNQQSWLQSNGVNVSGSDPQSIANAAAGFADPNGSNQTAAGQINAGSTTLIPNQEKSAGSMVQSANSNTSTPGLAIWLASGRSSADWNNLTQTQQQQFTTQNAGWVAPTSSNDPATIAQTGTALGAAPNPNAYDATSPGGSSTRSSLPYLTGTPGATDGGLGAPGSIGGPGQTPGGGYGTTGGGASVSGTAPNYAGPAASGTNASWNTPNVGSTAPAPISSFGPLPSVTPTYGSATLATSPGSPTANTVDPNQNQAYLQQYSQLLATQLAPQFQAQQQTLQDQAAARGLTGGAAQYGEDQLLGQQASALAGATQPIVSQAYGYTQQDIGANQNAINSLLAQGYSYQQATALANQQASNAQTGQNVSAANNAASQNAAYYGGALSADYTSYNNYLNSLLGYGSADYQGLQNTYLNSFAPNQTVAGAIGGEANSAGGAYSSTYNAGQAAQSQELGSVFGAAGTAAAGGAFGGSGAGAGASSGIA